MIIAADGNLLQIYFEYFSTGSKQQTTTAVQKQFAGIRLKLFSLFNSINSGCVSSVCRSDCFVMNWWRNQLTPQK